MSAYLLDASATVQCSHGGSATPTSRSTSVRLGGQAAVTQSSIYSISGCPNMVGNVNVPCVTGQWTSAANRVKSGDEALLLQDSQSTTIPNGSTLSVVSNQSRVKGT